MLCHHRLLKSIKRWWACVTDWYMSMPPLIMKGCTNISRSIWTCLANFYGTSRNIFRENLKTVERTNNQVNQIIFPPAVSTVLLLDVERERPGEVNRMAWHHRPPPRHAARRRNR